MADDRRLYARKGPVYDSKGNLICVLARDVFWFADNDAADFEQPKVKNGDYMPPPVMHFVFNTKPWTQVQNG